MTKHSLRVLVELVIVFLLIMGIFFVIVPVYFETYSKICEVRDSAIELLKEETGLEIKYEYMSPSIFKKIKLKNVSIVDSFSEIEILRVNEFAVYYDLTLLASEKPWTAFKNVVLDGGTIFWSKIRNEKLKSFLFFAEESLQKEKSTESTLNFDFKDFFSPITVSLKHIVATYELEKNNFAFNIDNASGNISSNGINLELLGDFGLGKHDEKLAPDFSSEFDLQVEIDSSFSEGTLNLIFESMKFSDFEINSIAFLGAYSNNIVELKTIQNLLPMNLSLVLDLQKETLDANFVAADISPSDLIDVKNTTSSLAKFSDISLSGNANVHLNDFSDFSYDCDFSIFVPTEILGSGGNARLSLNGNKDVIFINEMSVFSDLIDLEYDGDFFLNIGKENKLPVIPEGTLTISRFLLPSGFESSADIFIERRASDSSENCYLFIPELFFGKDGFSAIECEVIPQKDSIDLSLSMMNFAGLEYGLSGTVSLDASYSLGTDSFLQCYLGIDSLSVGAIANIASSFNEVNVSENVDASSDVESDVSSDDGFLDNLAITTELYATSDLENLAYNVTRLVVASVKDDSLYGLFSVSGNESRVSIEKIDVSSNGFKFAGDVFAERTGTTDFIFSSDFRLNEYPYSVSGMLQNGNSLSAFGDYGLYITANLNKSGIIDGSVVFEDLPLPLSPYYFALSLDTTFSFTDLHDWYVSINTFGFKEDSGNLPVRPMFTSSGAAEPSGVYLQSMSYGDSLSMLQGTASLTWNFDDLVRFIKLETTLASEYANESYIVDVSVSNPEAGDFFTPRNMFFSGIVNVNSFPFGRFLTGQSDADTLSAGITLTGSLENLFVNVDCSRFSVKLGDEMLNAQGLLSLEDSVLSLNGLDFSFADQNIKEFAGTLSFKDGSISLGGKYDGKVAANFLAADVNIDLQPTTSINLVENSSSLFENVLKTATALQEGFNANAKFSNILMKEVPLQSDLNLSVIRIPGETHIFAGETQAVSCVIKDDLSIVANGKPGSAFAFDLNGSLKEDEFLLDVKNVTLDLQKCWPFLGIDVVAFDEGTIVGNFAVSGYRIDPEFSGELISLGTVMRVPQFIGETLGPFDLMATAKDSQIDFGPLVITTQETLSDIWFKMSLFFDRWDFGRLDIETNTMNRQRIVGDISLLDTISIKGLATADLKMSIFPARMEMVGDLSLDDGAVCFSKFNFGDSSGSDFSFVADLNIAVGQHVEFIYPNMRVPILRALLKTSENFHLGFDGDKGAYSIKAEADIKGGEVFYFNRNFYIRSGKITINANQDIFDPIITFRAEVRERDEKENVRIILSANNQPLSSFVPRLSSEPPRSEAEILALLGQITVTDLFMNSNNEKQNAFSLRQVLASATDVLSQVTIARELENKIRNVLHLDLFSIRTMLLQNAIILSESKDEVKIGNYLDNTTVYIGKYFGSNIYLDGMFHLYYDKGSPADDVLGGLKLQLETGMELETPFFNMRWTFAPQLDSLKSNLGVGDTSVSLVWRFTY